MIEPWELRVWSPTGPGPRIIPRDETFIRSTGLRMQLTPEQDCREATFDAKGAGLGLKPLDCVQIVYGGTPLFYGELRDGGNVRDVHGHRHVLRSAALALKEVTLSAGFTTPQQPAHLTVRAILQDVVGSGGLGTPAVIEFDPALCPDLGFDCRDVVESSQQNAYALLERVVQDGAGLGVTVCFGVRPDRKFFCQPARNDTLDLEPDSLVSQNWKQPVAEDVVTAVRWFVAEKRDGTWLTHLSVSPEAAMYRQRVKSVSLASSEGVWTKADVQYTVSSSASVDVFEIGADGYVHIVSHDIQDALPRLTNGIVGGGREYTAARAFLDPGNAAEELYIDVTTNADKLVVEGEFGFVGDAITGEQRTFLGRQDTWAKLTFDGEDSDRVTSANEAIRVGHFIQARLAINMAVRPDIANWSANMWLTELRAERINTELLDRMAHHHYKTPAPEPADIELLAFIPPAQLPKYITLGDYQSIVDGWEYRMSAQWGMTLGCLTGQAEDPAALAQAELIKARDNGAVITAITAGGT